MPSTLLLDTVTWDLVLDANGDMAVAAEPYALAQDAASAIKTFLGEAYYNTAIGVPYANILGKLPSLSYLKAQLETAALTVPNVKAAAVFVASLSNRGLSGQVQVKDPAGRVVALENFAV